MQTMLAETKKGPRRVHKPFMHSTKSFSKVLQQPVVDWNKGKVVDFLLQSLRPSNGNDVLPIYVGNVKTDEDAFKVSYGRPRAERRRGRYAQ